LETFIKTENSCRVSLFPLIASCYKIVDSQTSFKFCYGVGVGNFGKVGVGCFTFDRATLVVSKDRRNRFFCKVSFDTAPCLSSSAGKSGAKHDECVDLAHHVTTNCQRLKLVGLMTIGAFGHDYSTGPNPDFECLIECRRRVCKALNISEADLDLSMGMSNDYQEAVSENCFEACVG